jgi:hypothetical protein
MSNMVVLPGLGSLMAGRRCGFVQIALALIGAVLVASWCIWFVWELSETLEFSFDMGPYGWALKFGGISLLVSWIWSFVTSLQIFCEVRSKVQIASKE